MRGERAAILRNEAYPLNGYFAGRKLRLKTTTSSSQTGECLRLVVARRREIDLALIDRVEYPVSCALSRSSEVNFEAMGDRGSLERSGTTQRVSYNEVFLIFLCDNDNNNNKVHFLEHSFHANRSNRSVFRRSDFYHDDDDDLMLCQPKRLTSCWRRPIVRSRLRATQLWM